MGQVVLEHVSRVFHTGAGPVPVLQDVSFELPDGEFCAFCGPSGSGKSTLLNLIGAIDAPDSGRVLVDGIAIDTLSDRALARFRNQKIGFFFQSFHLLPVLTAAENVAWPLYFQGRPQAERMREARKMLKLVGLADQCDRLPGKLSGGQRQRVAIARALVGRPAVVLADEPTANLDRRTAQDIMALLGRLNREEGVTLICATHDPMVMSHARMQVNFTEEGLHISRNPEAAHV